MTRIMLEDHLNCVGRTIPWVEILGCIKWSRGTEHQFVHMHSLLSSRCWRHKLLLPCFLSNDRPHFEVIKLLCESILSHQLSPTSIAVLACLRALRWFSCLCFLSHYRRADITDRLHHMQSFTWVEEIWTQAVRLLANIFTLCAIS